MMGTKIILMMLCANIFLVLSGFSVTGVNLMSSAEQMMSNANPDIVNTATMLWNLPGLFVDVISAPYALLLSVQVPAEIKLAFGLPYATLYTMAIIYWVRGRLM